MQQWYRKLTELANRVADITGHSVVIALMFVLVVVWFVVGVMFRYNDTWFTIMDAFVFLVTFFLVFIVQASQNADTRAMQDKLDAIIDALDGADTRKEGEEEELKKGRDILAK